MKKAKIIIMAIILSLSLLIPVVANAMPSEIDPESKIEMPEKLDQGKGNIKINNETSYSLFYQFREIHENNIIKISTELTSGSFKISKLEEEVTQISKNCQNLENERNLAKQDYEMKIQNGSSASEIQNSKKKLDEIEKQLNDKKQNLQNINNKIDVITNETYGKIVPLLPEYSETGWKKTNGQVLVDVNSFKGQKYFVLWVKMIDSVGNEAYDFSMYKVVATGYQEIPITSIMLNKSNLDITAGSSEQLIATPLPRETTDNMLVWVSMEPNIASVDSNGIVTGISNGKTIIAVTNVDGTTANMCNISVTGGKKPIEPNPEDIKPSIPQSPENPNNKLNKGDNTITNNKIPHAGLVTKFLIISIVISASVGIISYFKSKKIKIK